jgi:hypothetical protein
VSFEKADEALADAAGGAENTNGNGGLGMGHRMSGVLGATSKAYPRLLQHSNSVSNPWAIRIGPMKFLCPALFFPLAALVAGCTAPSTADDASLPVDAVTESVPQTVDTGTGGDSSSAPEVVKPLPELRYYLIADT